MVEQNNIVVEVQYIQNINFIPEQEQTIVFKPLQRVHKPYEQLSKFANYSGY